MKVSMFTRVIKSAKVNIAYSMMTGGFVTYPCSEGEIGQVAEGTTLFQRYVKTGILVPDDEDEQSNLCIRFDQERRRRDTLRFTILTTFQCNFSCVYCVEDGVKGPMTMALPLATEVAQFIVSCCRESQPKVLHIQFYGGEPLLNPTAVKNIAQSLCTFCQGAGIELVLSMITNGSLVRADLMQQLSALGLRYLQITLDGPREAHNQKRPYKRGRPSFDDIITNIRDVSGIVGVHLACNVDEQNEGAMPQLLDYLEETGLKQRIVRLNFNPISQRTPEESQPCNIFSLVKIKELTVQAFVRGFPVPVGVRHTICCMCRDRNPLIVDPQGVFYSCPAFVGREGFSIGNIDTGIKRNDLILMDAPQVCQSCPFLLVCSGSCRHINYSLYGDINTLHCTKDVLGDLVDASVMMAVAQRKIQATN